MGDTRAIFKFSGKIPCFNERLKTCLIGLNMFSRLRLIIVDEISSKPGLLLAFKLLNASFNPILHLEEGIHLNLYLQNLKTI